MGSRILAWEERVTPAAIKAKPMQAAMAAPIPPNPRIRPTFSTTFSVAPAVHHPAAG
jgi:hypothetical protein